MAGRFYVTTVLRLGWQPFQQSIRHGSKAVTRHKKPMHFLRQKLMALTEYVPPKPAVPKTCLIPRVKETQEPSGLEKVLFRRVVDLFRDNRMIVVFQSNYPSLEDMLIFQHRLHRHGIHVKVFPNKVLRSYLSTSPYQNLLPLISGHNLLVVSKEAKVKELLQAMRSAPQINLLGACIENTLLSHQGVVNYSKLPSLTVAQGHVIGNLTMMTSQTCTLLRRPTQQLVLLLQQYLKQQDSEL
ncbi:39S ribosomal protein L10, mitochondrial isoform X1 [Protopterus annectens]|uniref:39S ribosomal protein L10, mitochondrial isoform X1 n=1 Tax=Protopterus annectens TaxID=7888 RepID=UPI001CFBB8FB|nr:39S ribosomal protein L10, mitochondrial isoform X1 [Protopterus annectens]